MFHENFGRTQCKHGQSYFLVRKRQCSMVGMAEAVISSLLLQTETEKSKQILTNSAAVCPYKSKSRGHAK